MRGYLKRAREARRQHEFERGFGFVMTSFYLHKHPTYYIWDVVGAGAAFDPTPFDEGAFAALQHLPDPNDIWGQQQ